MGKRNNHYSVIVSDRAVEMLVQHVRFMAQVSPHAADRLRLEIIEAIKSLESCPERNSFLSDSILPLNKYRKIIIKKRYLVIYQLKEKIVYIDYIVDCRQDYQWLL